MEKPPVAGVIVEYSDPSGLYPSIARELHGRLPLKCLHWSNSSGFIRSIDNLYIDLVPDDRSSPTPDSTSLDGSSGAQDNGTVPKSEGSKRERRHQFPGLRRTPYLKIYFLHCSDVDTYRASSRKLLRDWVKSHSPSALSSSQPNKQENHDAFEWLIVNVLPSHKEEPRQSASIRTDGNAEKRPISSRWPSRSSSSVIEKIRSDFNGTSKNAVDRVAQVQLDDSQPVDTGQIKRQSYDDQRGWSDLSTKLKALILASFGLRVSQYEEDIKEKDMQRNLPGWNFNTFFVLKEGLAMGFENMGLFEDALTVYRELAVGLAAVIDGWEDSKGDNQQTTRFILYTDELKAAFEEAITITQGNAQHLDVSPSQTIHKSNGERSQVLDLGVSILDTDRKPFRNLILENNISVFDFQCYVFGRQMILLLRLANAVFPKTAPIEDATTDGKNVDFATSGYQPDSSQDESVNFVILAESIELSIDFIASVAQTVREDVGNAIKLSNTHQDENGDSLNAIKDNLTSSWTFSVCQCILEATSAASLSRQLDPLLCQLRVKTVAEFSHRGGQVTDAVYRNDLPTRSSSLPSQPTKPKSLPQESFPSMTSLDALRLLPPGSSHSGTPELAAHRGDLLALERRILSNIGLRYGGWHENLTDIASISVVQEEYLEDVRLDDELAYENRAVEKSSANSKVSTTAGIFNKNILSALESKKSFYAAYEDLTTSALAFYVVGDRKKAAEAMIADLAVIRFQLKDYNAAASYFRQLAPFYAKDDWLDLEIVMLNTYAECLGRLDRAEDYVRVALRTLAKIIRSPLGGTAERRSDSAEPVEILQVPSFPTVSLSSIIAASLELEQHISVPMEQYFDHIRLNDYIHHSPSRDGFTLLLKFRSLLPGIIKSCSVRARLISVGEEQRSELWLTTGEVQAIGPGLVKLTLNSDMMLPGWYTLGTLSIQSANLVFVHDLSPASSAPLFTKPRDSMLSDQSDSHDQQRILLWPAPRSLEARVTHCEEINLELPKSVKVEVFSGQNNVSKGKLLLRAASAGLRLHTAKAVVQSGKVEIIDKTQPGDISFSGLPADTKAYIKIPYSVESDLKDIIVRVEVMYTTPEGDFTYACNSKIPILLPIVINVQDIFKQDMLFSRFTIGTANSIPLRIFNCYLEGNDEFRVSSPCFVGTELDIFELQPLSFVSKIHKASIDRSGPFEIVSAQRRLYLRIEYRCLDEDICAAVESLFSAALERASFQKFSRIIKPTLSAVLRKMLSMQRLETSAIHREFTLGEFIKHDWELPLSGLANDEGGALATWLQAWHEEYRTIQLDKCASLSPMQYLTVPVDVPRVQILHTVRLKHLTRTSLNTEQDVVPIGKGVPMELIISHSRYWDSGQSQLPGDQVLDFCYELQANADWLVGGQRKGHYSAREDEHLSFSLLLWPQRTGNLLLPSIEVRPVARSHEITGEHTSARDSLITSEIDYKDQSCTISVVSDLLRTTVDLDPNGGVGGWLVESQGRDEDRT